MSTCLIMFACHVETRNQQIEKRKISQEDYVKYHHNLPL